MSLVNFLKFSEDSGAIISDEEYWNVFFRKRMHGDNLHSLLEPRYRWRNSVFRWFMVESDILRYTGRLLRTHGNRIERLIEGKGISCDSESERYSTNGFRCFAGRNPGPDRSEIELLLWI